MPDFTGETVKSQTSWCHTSSNLDVPKAKTVCLIHAKLNTQRALITVPLSVRRPLQAAAFRLVWLTLCFHPIVAFLNGLIQFALVSWMGRLFFIRNLGIELVQIRLFFCPSAGITTFISICFRALSVFLCFLANSWLKIIRYTLTCWAWHSLSNFCFCACCLFYASFSFGKVEMKTTFPRKLQSGHKNAQDTHKEVH